MIMIWLSAYLDLQIEMYIYVFCRFQSLTFFYFFIVVKYIWYKICGFSFLSVHLLN